MIEIEISIILLQIQNNSQLLRTIIYSFECNKLAKTNNIFDDKFLDIAVPDFILLWYVIMNCIDATKFHIQFNANVYAQDQVIFNIDYYRLSVIQ